VDGRERKNQATFGRDDSDRDTEAAARPCPVRGASGAVRVGLEFQDTTYPTVFILADIAADGDR
jgi:hypothetical protein